MVNVTALSMMPSQFGEAEEKYNGNSFSRAKNKNS